MVRKQQNRYHVLKILVFKTKEEPRIMEYERVIIRQSFNYFFDQCPPGLRLNSEWKVLFRIVNTSHSLGAFTRARLIKPFHLAPLFTQIMQHG